MTGTVDGRGRELSSTGHLWDIRRTKGHLLQKRLTTTKSRDVLILHFRLIYRRDNEVHPTSDSGRERPAPRSRRYVTPPGSGRRGLEDEGRNTSRLWVLTRSPRPNLKSLCPIVPKIRPPGPRGRTGTGWGSRGVGPQTVVQRRSKSPLSPRKQRVHVDTYIRGVSCGTVRVCVGPGACVRVCAHRVCLTRNRRRV